MELFWELCTKYDIYPQIDACATKENTKCLTYIVKEDDALTCDFKRDVWCNPPHSKSEKFVRHLYNQWLRSGDISIMMILPTNTMSARYWHECIEGKAEYHPIQGRIKFLVNGKPSEHQSRNAYVCVIWRKRNIAPDMNDNICKRIDRNYGTTADYMVTSSLSGTLGEVGLNL